MSLIRFLPKYAKGLLTCAYVFTVGVAKESNRLFIYQLCRRFGWKVDEFPPEIPTAPLARFLSGTDSVRLSQLDVAPGNVSLTELTVLAAICAARRPAAIFEIGTFDGRTTLNLAENSPPDARIYTLDLPAAQIGATAHALAAGEDAFVRKRESGARFASSPHASRITQLYGDSAQFDFSPYRGAIDLVFVDASHAYEYVLADTRSALAMLRPGGVILWHDYGTGDWPGVNRALNELRRTDPRLANLRWIRRNVAGGLRGLIRRKRGIQRATAWRNPLVPACSETE